MKPSDNNSSFVFNIRHEGAVFIIQLHFIQYDMHYVKYKIYMDYIILFQKKNFLIY